MKRKRVVEEPPDFAGSVTIRDVARKAHVSLSSVSRVLTKHPNVSRRMEQRVLKAAGSLRYEPHFIAQSLRRGVTHTFGFLIGDLSNPVFADIIRGAEDFARAHGYAVMLTNSVGDASLDAEHLRLFLRRRVDGIILSTVEMGSTEISPALMNPAVPLVVLDRDIPEHSRVSTVFADHATGMREATSHLIRRGHQSIALVSGAEDLRPARERRRGFLDAFESAGLNPKEGLIRAGSLRPEFGREETASLLALADPPSAIIAGSNRLLTGVLEAIHAAGRTVGQDLALVSCDDVDLARLYRPPISVVVRDTYQMGRAACELLIERLANPDAPVRSLTLPTRFEVRASSDFAWPSSASA
jgi:LacI family transcriptional regulator